MRYPAGMARLSVRSLVGMLAILGALLVFVSSRLGLDAPLVLLVVFGAFVVFLAGLAENRSVAL